MERGDGRDLVHYRYRKQGKAPYETEEAEIFIHFDGDYSKDELEWKLNARNALRQAKIAVYTGLRVPFAVGPDGEPFVATEEGRP